MSLRHWFKSQVRASSLYPQSATLGVHYSYAHIHPQSSPSCRGWWQAQVVAVDTCALLCWRMISKINCKSQLLKHIYENAIIYYIYKYILKRIVARNKCAHTLKEYLWEDTQQNCPREGRVKDKWASVKVDLFLCSPFSHANVQMCQLF